MPRNKSERVPEWATEYLEATKALIESMSRCPNCSDNGLRMSCYRHGEYARYSRARQEAQHNGALLGLIVPGWQGSFSSTQAAIESFIASLHASQSK